MCGRVFVVHVHGVESGSQYYVLLIPHFFFFEAGFLDAPKFTEFCWSSWPASSRDHLVFTIPETSAIDKVMVPDSECVLGVWTQGPILECKHFAD